MRDQLIDLLERADLALGSAAGVIDDETLEPVIATVRAVRTRLAYPEDVLVAALAGGTGSGKSSLFNALCGADLVDVGGVRPTTSHPAATVPVAIGSAMDGYLDRLGIEERHTHLGAKICLLDLPDTDSVEIDHRHRVAALLPLVDLVVWVVDPEKYRDARLHDEYLKPLSAYSNQFVFVLNQVDRLSGIDADDVRHDLMAALEEDRIESPEVVVTAANPPVGPPMGLDRLRETLEARRARRATLYDKLLTDLEAASRGLEQVAGKGLDFDRRAEEAVAGAASELVAGDLPAATERLTGLVEALQAESGGVTAEKLAVIAAEVPDHLRRIEAQLGDDGLPARGWLRRLFRREQEVSREEQAGRAQSLITEAVIRPTRAVLARRAMAVASVAELAVEVASLRN